MKGIIFMVVVTLMVFASFARPEKENNSPEIKTINKSTNTITVATSADSSSVPYKKG